MREILHLHIPAFPIAVARVVDPSLAGRPVAVAPGCSGRTLLQCVSAEARAEGVVPGMAADRALHFCPALRLVPPDPLLAVRAMTALQKLAQHYSPLLEAPAPGRLYFDLTGSARLLGPGRDVAMRLEREIMGRMRLAGSVGVAANKLVSRIASGYLQRPGVCDVLRGSEATFIGALPVAVLPGIGPARQERLLHDLNLRRVEEVAALSVLQLRLVCGAFAPLLHQRARGVDPSPVQPPARTPEIVEEVMLEQAENDDDLLLAALGRLAEACAFRLRQAGRGARQLTLTVHYQDGVSERRSTAFAVPERRDWPLLEAAEQLFFKACRRRLRIRSLVLAARRLETGVVQMDLFDEPLSRPSRCEELQGSLDKLRQTYGADAVHWGRSVGRPG